MFPRITHFDDVDPYVVYEKGINVRDRPGYAVVDYAFVQADTFDSPMARECRGLKFGRDGELLARPFHKFFNLGEAGPAEAEDFGQPHVVLDKLDGSMIHPCLLQDELRLMTRGGLSPQAAAAERAADPAVWSLCRALDAAGMTPMFEFTSPDNRVVVAYETTALTLLAVREKESGTYVPHAELQAIGVRYGVPVVQGFGAVRDLGTFVAEARALEGLEGYVVAFEDGHRLKLKAEGYVLRHRALSDLKYEKVLLAWIAEDALDDVLAILPEEAAARVAAYAETVLTALARYEAEVVAVHQAHRDASRRDYAMAVKAALDPRLQNAAFKALDGQSVRDALRKLLRWAAHSEPRVDTVRDLFGMRWDTHWLTDIDA